MKNPSFLHRLWPVARRVMLLMALAGSLCAVGVGLERIAHRVLEQTAAEAMRAREAVAQNQRALEAHRLYVTRYAQLRKQGRIGELSRSGVLEAVQVSAARLGLRHLTVELQPPVIDGHLAMSRMILQVGLLHEGELLRLFDQLRARVPALLRVRRCTLERSDASDTSVRQATDNLRADCLVEWLTVRAQ